MTINLNTRSTTYNPTMEGLPDSGFDRLKHTKGEQHVLSFVRNTQQ